MKNPLVSIILSTYNGSKYIKKSINSVLNQTYTNIEFIIINDCSIDNVEHIILNFKKKDNRITYKKNKLNINVSKSRNKGILVSKGKYIAIIDDDDIWLPNKLQKQVHFMENNIDYGLCGTGTILINSNGKEINKIKTRTVDNNIRNNLLKSNQFIHSSVIIRVNILNKIGFYNPQVNNGEDYDLWLRIGQISKLYNIPEYLTKYRWLETSISRKKWLNQEILSFKIMISNRYNYPNFLKSLFIKTGYIVLKILKIKK